MYSFETYLVGKIRSRQTYKTEPRHRTRFRFPSKFDFQLRRPCDLAGKRTGSSLRFHIFSEDLIKKIREIRLGKIMCVVSPLLSLTPVLIWGDGQNRGPDSQTKYADAMQTMLFHCHRRAESATTQFPPSGSRNPQGWSLTGTPLFGLEQV